MGLLPPSLVAACLHHSYLVHRAELSIQFPRARFSERCALVKHVIRVFGVPCRERERARTNSVNQQSARNCVRSAFQHSSHEIQVLGKVDKEAKKCFGVYT